MKALVILGFILLAIGVTGTLWQQGTFSMGTLPKSSEPFIASPELSYEQGKQLYIEATEALHDKDYQEALSSYERIAKPYRLLRPLILVHQSEAYAQLGQEMKTQQLLQRVIKENKQSAMAQLATYHLGQSGMRSHDTDMAKNAFIQVIKEDQPSNLHVGSHYYLGVLAYNDDNKEDATDHWLAYIKDAPEGTFSLEAAKGLEELLTTVPPETARFIGQAYYHHGENRQAVSHLKQAPFQDSWFLLGKVQLALRQKQQGQQTLKRGLLITTDQEQAELGIKTLIRSYSSRYRKQQLKQLLAQKPKVGQDFILWQLKFYSSGTEKTRYSQQLLTQFPDSNWAPETSWELAWHHFKKGQTSTFLTKANAHIERYPYSRSAPRLLFWKSKVYLKQGKTTEAHALLTELHSKYPHQYYAFRAKQILDNTPHPWKTQPTRTYPPTEDIKNIAPSALLSFASPSEHLTPMLTELIELGQAQDVALLLRAETKDDLTPPIQSWVAYQQKDYAHGIRLIRDYLDEQRIAGQPNHNPELLKLLYPITYANQIKRYSKQNRLDPLLVQALTRQESYFNHLAVSSSNAMGLMQLLPSTAREVARWEKIPHFVTSSLFIPDRNIRLGTRYLNYLHERFHGNSMQSVGAYNGGPGAMSRWSKASAYLKSDPDRFVELIPYEQSRNYIKEVFSHYWNYQALYAQDAT